MPIFGYPELILITSILFLVGFFKTKPRTKSSDVAAFTRLKRHLVVLLSLPTFLFLVVLITSLVTTVENAGEGIWRSLLAIGGFVIATLTFIAAPYLFGFLLKRTLFGRSSSHSHNEPPR